MRPTLKKSLLMLVLGAACGCNAYADFDGGRIINENDASADVPVYTGDIIVDYSVNDGNIDAWYGGVHRYGATGSDGTTTLAGNISISAGYENRDDTSTIYRNIGVLIGNDDWSGNYEPASGANIVLKTVQSSDSIRVDTYSVGGHGVAIVGSALAEEFSTILLDASTSTQGVVIKMHNTGAGDATGLRASGKAELEVKGNVTIEGAGQGGLGISVNSNAGGTQERSASVNVTGKVDVNMVGKGSVGVRASGSMYSSVILGEAGFGGTHTVTSGSYGVVSTGTGSDVTVNGNLKVTTTDTEGNAHGLLLQNDSTFSITGDLDITTYSNLGHGICMGTSSSRDLTINGAKIRTMAEGAYAIASTSMSGAVVRGAGVFDIAGATAGLVTSNMGSIDLRLQGRSSIETYTVNGGTGTIDLTLQDASLWTVTGNSTLTNLTLGQGSTLQLGFSGSALTDIITATGSITLEAGSIIYLTGDLSSLQGGSFDFFSGTVDNQGVKFIGFDGVDWVEYEYTQTGANTFEFASEAPVVIEEPGFVPEPATAALGLLGLASLSLRRRRK